METKSKKDSTGNFLTNMVKSTLGHNARLIEKMNNPRGAVDITLDASEQERKREEFISKDLATYFGNDSKGYSYDVGHIKAPKRPRIGEIRPDIIRSLQTPNRQDTGPLNPHELVRRSRPSRRSASPHTLHTPHALHTDNTDTTSTSLSSANSHFDRASVRYVAVALDDSPVSLAWTEETHGSLGTHGSLLAHRERPVEWYITEPDTSSAHSPEKPARRIVVKKKLHVIKRDKLGAHTDELVVTATNAVTHSGKEEMKTTSRRGDDTHKREKAADEREGRDGGRGGGRDGVEDRDGERRRRSRRDGGRDDEMDDAQHEEKRRAKREERSRERRASRSRSRERRRHRSRDRDRDYREHRDDRDSTRDSRRERARERDRERGRDRRDDNRDRRDDNRDRRDDNRDNRRRRSRSSSRRRSGKTSRKDDKHRRHDSPERGRDRSDSRRRNNSRSHSRSRSRSHSRSPSPRRDSNSRTRRRRTATLSPERPPSPATLQLEAMVARAREQWLTQRLAAHGALEHATEHAMEHSGVGVEGEDVKYEYESGRGSADSGGGSDEVKREADAADTVSGGSGSGEAGNAGAHSASGNASEAKRGPFAPEWARLLHIIQGGKSVNARHR